MDNKKARAREKIGFELTEGVKNVFRPPCVGLLPIIALTVLLYIGLKKRSAIMPTQPASLASIIITVAIIMVFVVFLIAVLALLGTPNKHWIAESASLSVFKLQNTPEECPILISSRRKKDGTRCWIFYSEWVPMRVWREDNNKNVKDICSVLGCHLVSQIEYGGKNKEKCHRIVFYTKSGVGHEKGGVINDDEF